MSPGDAGRPVLAGTGLPEQSRTTTKQHVSAVEGTGSRAVSTTDELPTGSELRARRRATGRTQRISSDLAGVSRSAVSMYEIDARRPSGEAGRRYLAFLDGEVAR